MWANDYNISLISRTQSLQMGIPEIENCTESTPELQNNPTGNNTDYNRPYWRFIERRHNRCH